MSSPRLQFLAFVLTAVTVYGSVHAYVWWRTAQQLRLRGGAAVAVAVLFALLVAAPFLGRMHRDGSPALAALELVAFVWMACVFYLFCLNLAADGWNLAAALLRRAAPGGAVPHLGGPWLFRGICAATAAILAWSALEAQAIRTVRLTVPTAKLPPGSPPIRVVQISDLHLGLLAGPRRLEGFLRRVRAAEPHLLVATGDVLDAVGDRLAPLAAALREIEPPLGKYAVTGNHEYYSGIAGAVAFLEGAGFRVLRDAAVVIDGRVLLAGREYQPPRGFPGAPAPRPLDRVLGDRGAGLFTVLAKHVPLGFAEEAVPLGVDLQLSGHTHDGQLFPFRWLVRLSFPRTAGLFRSGESLLYVSRGTGTWGPPLRFLAPPEVTVFTIVPAAAGPR